MGAASTMVVHVAPRGKDMPGLMRYLYGPGKTNEHTDQHAVAASSDLEFAFAGSLTGAEASELGRALEAAWHEQMAEANALVGAGRGGVSRSTMKSGTGAVTDAEKEHVYHLIVSLPPGAAWSDEQWSTIARDVVEGMGFTDSNEDAKGARWAAVRHGLSAGGNDHLHIAVSLVRQDGRRVQLPQNDYRAAQQVRQRIEQTREFVLPLHEKSRSAARSLPGYTQAEHATAQERGVVPDRVVLQNVVRAAATSARTEAQWLDAVMDVPDVEIEPVRWAAGGRDAVLGYKVRLGDGIWLTASQLAPDLTLAKIRPQWTLNEDDQSRAAALAIWRDEAPLTTAPVPAAVSTHLDTAEAALARWSTELDRLDPYDRQAWRQVARDVAGVTSSIARDLQTPDVDVLTAAQTLSRQALEVVEPSSTPHADVTSTSHAAKDSAAHAYGPSPAQLAARHVQLAMRAGGTASHPGWMAVLQQLRQVVAAVEAAQRARRELVSAQQLAGARRALQRAQETSHAAFRGCDVVELRDAWRAREISRTGDVRRPTVAADGTSSSTASPGRGPQAGRGVPGPDRPAPGRGV